MTNERINELREAMGTLPSERPVKETYIYFGCEKLDVEIIDYNENPYKSIFAIATATWGNDDYINKWNELDPLNRYFVVLSALTGNTLPTALESVTFTFKVTGLPRHCFDQHARARIGTGFGSSGCRDNNKLDASIILYTYYKELFEEDAQLRDIIIEHFKQMKDIYEMIVKEDQGTWQAARSVLPMSYHHPYHFTQNLLALMGQCNRRMQFCEEEFIVGLHWLIRYKIEKLG